MHQERQASKGFDDDFSMWTGACQQDNLAAVCALEQNHASTSKHSTAIQSHHPRGQSIPLAAVLTAPAEAAAAPVSLPDQMLWLCPCCGLCCDQWHPHPNWSKICACGVRLCYDCDINRLHSCFDVDVEAAPLPDDVTAPWSESFLASVDDVIQAYYASKQSDPAVTQSHPPLRGTTSQTFTPQPPTATNNHPSALQPPMLTIADPSIAGPISIT